MNTKHQLTCQAYDLLVSGVSQAYFDRDSQTLWNNLKTKTTRELLEIIARWTAIHAVTEEEMDAHCDFSGTFLEQ